MALDDLAGSEEYFTGHRSEISTSGPHYAEAADLKKELKLDYCGINLALFGFLGSTIGLLGAALIASRVDYVSLIHLSNEGTTTLCSFFMGTSATMGIYFLKDEKAIEERLQQISAESQSRQEEPYTLNSNLTVP